MTRKIKIWKDPYGECYSTTKAKNIEFEPGLTVLVGCNGAGKSTLLMNIKSKLEKENIPVFEYNNLTKGGQNARSEMFFQEDYSMFATAFSSSEGENISINLGNQVSKWKRFLKEAKTSERFEMTESEYKFLFRMLLSLMTKNSYQNEAFLIANKLKKYKKRNQRIFFVRKSN